MQKKFRARFSFLSDNRKSKIKNRKWVGIFAIVLILVGGVETRAQQQKKIPRLGYLTGFEATRESARSNVFRRALREIGYIDGRNIVIEYRSTEGKSDRHRELVAELMRLNVDIFVVAGGYEMIRAAKNATDTIPIVMAGRGIDPVKAGFVESLARPGRNVTGVTLLTTELAGKRLELFKQAAPKVSRVAVLYEPAALGGALEVKEVLPVAAVALGLTIQPWEVLNIDGFERAFAALGKQRPDGLYVSGGPLTNIGEKRIVSFAVRSRLPSVYGSRETVESGGLLSYGADLEHTFQRVAVYVDKILKGAKPADLPVEQPTKFELIINLKAAKQIGLTIPPNVLARADKVIR